MNHDEQQERIDDFLTGRLGDTEDFERQLQAQPQLKTEMEATRRALEAIDISEHHRLKRRLQQLETDHVGPRAQDGARVIPIRHVRKRRWLTLAATAALLLFLAGYLILAPDRDPAAVLAVRDIEPFGQVPSPGSDANYLLSDPRAAAYVAYEAGDYAGAAAAFRRFGAPEPVDRFYLAQSLLAQADYAEAATLFEDLVDLTDFNLSAEAAYYRAVARLGAGEWVDAKAQLSRIADTPGHPSRDAAEQLLDKF
ncbi:tetratricopeptide repeat protein [Neolewinella litorea]|uniref:Tetratricopeptide repeat protein n=1 Tax=Neolewinella litorea TaxID=2562452 RepID=A0A4V3XKP0_9BACT|nr:hypothetical protein [Neolewinella litorea]THH37683.1 hypothetical protein E4021_13390 [Neolewinella litorea]